MDSISYIYQFEFQNGRKEEFHLKLDSKTLSPVQEENIKVPEWARLEFKQCLGCPLTLETIYCPLAKQIAPLVDTLKDVISIEETQVTVIQNERVISNDTTAQEGISSVMGVLTAVSGCPLTQFSSLWLDFTFLLQTLRKHFTERALCICWDSIIAGKTICLQIWI